MFSLRKFYKINQKQLLGNFLVGNNFIKVFKKIKKKITNKN